jgi:hypothetical protein
VDLGADLGRARVDAGGLRIEDGPAAIEGRIGPARHSVGAHAPGELRHVDLDLLVVSLAAMFEMWTITAWFLPTRLPVVLQSYCLTSA